MSKKTAVLSLGYWFSATTLGMLVHPYKTMREIVRRKSLRMSVWAPVVWGVFFWLGAIVLIVLGRGLGSYFEIFYPSVLYLLLRFLFWWVMWVLILWQVMALYLFARFRKAFGNLE